MFNFLGGISYIALAAMWRGYVLTFLWSWFVVVGLGAKPLTVPLAIGVSLLVSFLTLQRAPMREKVNAGDYVNMLLMPLLALGMGWITNQFV